MAACLCLLPAPFSTELEDLRTFSAFISDMLEPHFTEACAESPYMLMQPSQQ